VSSIIDVIVNPSTNTKPVAVNDTLIVKRREVGSLNVISNDIELDVNQELTSTLLSGFIFGTETLLPNGIFSFDATNIALGTYTYTYQLCDNGTPILCDTASIVVVVASEKDFLKEPFVPQGFSPNDDGENDNFVITVPDGWEDFAINIKIYSRWGALLFEQENYQNTWSGQTNRGASIGERLPDGTYFYEVELSNGYKKVGFVVLQR
jgi:gliding motility-associated-like protein